MSRLSASGRPWKRLQAEVFAEEVYCWKCGRPVDMDLPPLHPLARSVDHVIRLADGGTHERSNLRLCHRSCNSVGGGYSTGTGPTRAVPRQDIVYTDTRRPPYPSQDGVGRSRDW